MKTLQQKWARSWMQISPRMLPFADAASDELPLPRLLRLALFQVSVGMAVVLLSGTLNRVMILELGVPAWLVALMVSLPLLFAPARALIGFRSDTHRSALGWRRVPYIWFGSLLQFGGLAIMPFALIILSGDSNGPAWLGPAAAALAFLLTGVGLHTTQTAGLALATDLAPQHSRPRVVALLYVMLLVGMGVSALLFGALLADFSQIRLIRVVQGAAAFTMVLNGVALWKQEVRDPSRTRDDLPRPRFGQIWQQFIAQPGARRYLLAVMLGTAAFSMQDVLLEPYGGEILGLSVSATTVLTALLAGGTLVALAWAARRLARGADPMRLAASGSLCGIVAFAAVIFAAPLHTAELFRLGTTLIGFGGGLFAVGMLCKAMEFSDGEASDSGLSLGAWGAAQATAAGLGLALGGGLRDATNHLVNQGLFGTALEAPLAGYSLVYHLEIGLLFITLVALGPLVRPAHGPTDARTSEFGLAEFPS